MRFRLGFALVLCALAPAFGQGTKSGSTSGSAGGGSNPSVPSVPNPGSTTYIGPNSNLPVGFQASPQFINGKAMMDNGTPPPEGTPIQRICGTVQHIEGYTDGKGGFGFEMGHDDVVQDASYSGHATLNPNNPSMSSDPAFDPDRPYRNCSVQADLAGYHSDAVSLAAYKPGDNSNVGTLVLHRMGNVDGTVISATSAAAPHNAVKEFEKGMDDVRKGKTADALDAFRHAVELYPQYAAAWLELGKLQTSLRQPADAEQSFQHAVQAEPKLLSPYLQLAQLEFEAHKWRETADTTDQLLKLDAYDYPRAYYFNGLANYTLNRMEPAEKSLRETIKLDSQHQFPKAHQFLAAILVTKKDFSGAQEELRSYLKLAPNAPDADNVRHQLNGLEAVARPAGK